MGAAEELRSAVPFGGFPWGRLAFAQADAPFKGLAAVGGMALVTFAVALCGALLAAAVRTGPTGRRTPARVAAIVGAALVVRAGRAPGAAADRRHPGHRGGGPGQRPAVAGSTRSASRPPCSTTTSRRPSGWRRQIDAGTKPRPALVVWPENSTDIDPYADASAAAAIQGAVDAVGAPTLVGAVVTNPDDPSTVLNLGIVWAPSGTPTAAARGRPTPSGTRCRSASTSRSGRC